MGLTYKKAGVDIGEGEKFARDVGRLARSTFVRGVLEGVGGFGSVFDPKMFGMKDPLLVAGTDGVGTKLALARAIGRVDTIGIDLVAMCVNDILTLGAVPAFFLDYYACGKLDRGEAVAVLRGIARGCKEAGCALIGGETAEMPGFYRKGEFDVGGFAVGLVERDKLVNGSGVLEGDIAIGLPSSGCHSNGYSLVRKILSKAGAFKRGKVVDGFEPIVRKLLTPTRIYVRSILKLIERINIKAMAHITGGGISGNLGRQLPKGLGVEVFTENIPISSIFKWLMKGGDVDSDEMFRVFNMGCGFAVFVSDSDAESAARILAENGERPFLLGRVKKIRGSGKIIFK